MNRLQSPLHCAIFALSLINRDPGRCRIKSWRRSPRFQTARLRWPNLQARRIQRQASRRTGLVSAHLPEAARRNANRWRKIATPCTNSTPPVFTASTDTFDGQKGNKAFAESLKADYPILSDPDGSTAKAYGVYNESRNFASRVTFYIDRDGKIAAIDDKIDAQNAGADVVNKLREIYRHAGKTVERSIYLADQLVGTRLLAHHRHAELLGLVELAAGLFAGHDVIGFL